MTPEALELLVEAGLDGMNVDIKGDEAAVWKYGKGIEVEKIWARCRQARDLGVHLEITLLVIPGVNDHDSSLRGIACRIAEELGPDTPWHVSAYFPSYRFGAPPTSMGALERAHDIGREAGLKYVYLGNAPGHRHDNTYCPQCGAVLIERLGYSLIHYDIDEGACPHCGCTIVGRW
jgi:pyruvate formate lyase activating enzyme